MSSSFNLKTPRLTLKILDPKNADHISQMLSTYNSPFVNAPTSTTASTLLQKLRTQSPRNRPDLCTKASGIQLPDSPTHLVYLNDVYIGFVSLSFRASAPYPDLGFAFEEAYTGKGYATEACRASLEFWRETVGVRDVVIGTDPGNVRARRMAERLRFVEKGVYFVDVEGGEVRSGLPYVLKG